MRNNIWISMTLFINIFGMLKLITVRAKLHATWIFILVFVLCYGPYYWATLIIVLTHPALVWTRPRCQYSLKNCGIDIPRNSESPVMMRFLIEFILVNWRNDNPTEAENKETSYIKERNKKKTKFSYKTGCSLKLQLYSVK